MYVSGGLGARWEGEAFGSDFELPNERAYTETCAAIGSVMWNWRMLLMRGDAKYADLIEHTLYNAVLPGVSLDGQSYFYQNPLADDGRHRREPWFGCACCPPNVARLLASLTGYFYAVSSDAIWVNLYAESEATVDVSGNKVVLSQTTNYPWDGAIRIDINPDRTAEFAINVRIPVWADGATVTVNGAELQSAQPGSYVAIRQSWKQGDSIEIDFPFRMRTIRSHPLVMENSGRVALFHGPLLYCVESVDNPDVEIRTVGLAKSGKFDVRFEPDLLGGVNAIGFVGVSAAPQGDWEGLLYCDSQIQMPFDFEPVELRAIPYFAWANRQAGRMQVWLVDGR